MRETLIVGVGMTPFGRFPETPLGELAARAAAEALADASASPAAAQAIVFANATQGALEGQHGIRGQAALDGAGFGNAPVFNVENACASASTALNLAHVLVGSEIVRLRAGDRSGKDGHARSGEEHGRLRGKLGPVPASADHRQAPGDGTRNGAAAGGGGERASQRVHGRLRGLLPAPHGEVRHDAAADGGGQRQEPSAFRPQPAFAVPAEFFDRGGARRSSDRLAADASDVQPDQRWRGGRARLFPRIRGEAWRSVARRAHSRIRADVGRPSRPRPRSKVMSPARLPGAPTKPRG